MEIEVPKIDSRAAPEIASEVVSSLKAGRWPKADPNGKDFEPEKGASGALINIFARFAELIIERLNQVPEKNLLAFLDMLGASLLPPRPARTPLTFSLVEGAKVGAVVPAGTQVAATAIAEEKEPVIFETERELEVTTARLTSVFARDRQTDKYADYKAILPPSDQNQDRPMPAEGVSVFEGDTNIEHVLYIAHDGIFRHPGRTKLEMTFALSAQAAVEVIWEVSDGGQWKQVTGTPRTITKDGALDLKALSPEPIAVEGIEKRWLRCRLKDSVLPTPQPPDINGISLAATFEKRGMVEKAFTNNFPVDTSRGFFPFGETPREGDVFYLSIDEAFAESNCTVTFIIESSLVSKPSTDSTAARLKWEFWSGTAWQAMNPATDSSSAFTKSGSVILSFSTKPEKSSVNGVEAWWLRAKLSGSYGAGASLTPKYDSTAPDKIVGYDSKPAVAPLITSLLVTYKTEVSAEPPELVLTCNDFAYEKISREALVSKAPFKPFKPSELNWKVAYLGFELPAGVSAFPKCKISIYVSASGEKNPLDRPEVEWQYSTGAEWAGLIVRDGTEDFTQPGLIEFLAPPDFEPRLEFGLSRYWLRAVLKNGTYRPRVSCLLLNTVMASRVTSVVNEVLGSSDGSKNQTFRTALAPVLEGERLEVREPDMPSTAEQEVIARENGEDAISITRDEAVSGLPNPSPSCMLMVT